MPSGITPDGILLISIESGVRLLFARNGSYDVAEDIQQSLVLVVSELARIHEHAMLFTGFILKVLLLRVIQFLHWLTAAGTLNITHCVIGFTDLGIAAISKVSHPVALQLLGFAVIKP